MIWFYATDTSVTKSSMQWRFAHVHEVRKTSLDARDRPDIERSWKRMQCQYYTAISFFEHYGMFTIVSFSSIQPSRWYDYIIYGQSGFFATTDDTSMFTGRGFLSLGSILNSARLVPRQWRDASSVLPRTSLCQSRQDDSVEQRILLADEDSGQVDLCSD